MAKIRIDSDLLSNGIKSLQRLVQAAVVACELKEGQLYITGSGNGNSATLTVPVAKVEEKKGAKSFNIDANAFLGAIAKRKEIALEIGESNAVVTASGYKAELLIHAFEAPEVIPDEVLSEKGLKLKDSFLKALRENLPKLELKPLLAMYDFVPIGIKSTKEDGTFVACFDDFQSAFYEDKELKANLEFMMPSNVFSMIAREIKDQDYTMAVNDTAIYAWNDMFQLALARPQAEGNQISLEQMMGLYTEIRKRKDFVTLKLQTEGIKSLLENTRAIYEKDSTFTVKTKGDACNLLLKSSYGQIAGKIKLNEAPKKDVEFTCDFQFFATLLEKAPAELTLRVGKDMLLFTNKPVVYLLSLV